jgi:hypothetical protein
MPDNIFNNVPRPFWPEAPPHWPWNTEKERDLVWNRDLSDKFLHVIQEVASLYGKWIVPIIECGPEAELLVAASLSLPRLRRLVEDVTFAILQPSPRQKAHKGAITHRRTKRHTKEEARLGLLRVVEGIQCISLVITGKEYDESLEQPDTVSDDRHVGLGHSPSHWSPLAIFAHDLLARGLEDDWQGIRTRLQSLPTEDVLHRRLESGLRLAAKDFLAFSKKVTGNAHGSIPECDAYQRALAALSDITAERVPQAWRRWYAATGQVHAAGQEWRRVHWVEAQGSQTNESLRVQMLLKESRVRQYALMMRGNGQRLRAIKLLKALHVLLQSARRDAVTLCGKWSATPPRRLQSRFDVDIVEPDIRERWESALAGPLKKCGPLIRIATRDVQQEAWLLQKYYRQFVKKGLVGGTRDAYRKRHIVEELLAPMQAIGLAAQLPWGRVLQAGLSRRTTGASQSRVTLDTCHGKAWVVNPLALVYRPRKRSRKR